MHRSYITILIIFLNISAQSEGYKNAEWGESKSSVQKKIKPEKKESCSFSFYSTSAEGEVMEKHDVFPGMRLSDLGTCNLISEVNRCQKKIYSKYSLAKVGIGCGVFFEGKYVGQINSIYESTIPLMEDLKKKYGQPNELGGFGRKTSRSNGFLFKIGTTEIYALENLSKANLDVIYFNSQERSRLMRLELAEISKKRQKENSTKKHELQKAKDSL